MASPRIVPTGVLGGPAGPSGKDGSNVLPTDTAIKQAIQDSTSQTAVALAAAYTPKVLAKTTASNQTQELVRIQPKSTQSGAFRIIQRDVNNTDSTVNSVTYLGWNVGDTHNPEDNTKPATAMGFESNFYDTPAGGDNNHGPEFYLETADAGGGDALFRPFYARGSWETGHNRWTTHFDIGTDGNGHLDIYAGKGNPVLFTVASALIQSTRPFLVSGSTLTLAPASGQPILTVAGANPTVALQHGSGSASWQVQSTGVNALTFYNKDVATHAVFTYGATALTALSQFASRLLVTGSDITLSPASGASSLTLNTAAAQASVIFQRAGSTGWIMQGATLTSLVLYNKDLNPAATFTYGAGVTGLADFASGLKVQGNVGFYGKTPVAQPARPTDLAGVIAVLVANGLTA